MSPVQADIASWMKYIPDDYNVNQLTIPGTHDSHSVADKIRRNGWAFTPTGFGHTQTQRFPILEQLEMGVRYLDLRVGGDNYSMWHGKVQLFDTIFDVTSGINEWLKKHPTEVILISVKWDEDGASTKLTMESTILDIWRGYGWFTAHNWPMMKEARGKAVLLRRYGISSTKPDPHTSGIDFGDIYGHKTHYNSDSIGSFDQQDDGNGLGLDPERVWENGWKQLDQSRGASFHDAVAHFTILAMNSWPGRWPLEYADWINPALMRHLADDGNHIDPTNQRYGVIVLDFIYPQHCLAIISKNWQQTVINPVNNSDHGQVTGGLLWKSRDNPIYSWKNGAATIDIYFGRNVILKVVKDGADLWTNSEVASSNSSEHNMFFASNGNLVIYDGRIEGDPRWQTGTRHGWRSRLRFMGGPPYIMIDAGDSDDDKGRVLWTTFPL